ncbi:GNAT family N-acetyltransferase [Lysobacter solisilvae (ex Woo and Kim 2020)]|uniref:GNAT family N-acetyltransferase n=1 Tax=Agrilutibacter terrestris TaxID=2865112 RepID=A0A7H0G0B0_9GAMM|nr:GNAT family N-acetyltransferase [Lysobacter terrestris]QNP41726.1 GNAT family N-acetyltransferase [Lysobacter terrestris]
MTRAREIALEDLHAGQFVRATLLDRIDVEFAGRADDRWLTFTAAEVAQARAEGKELSPPQHLHWRWQRKVDAARNLLPYPTMAIECEGDAQGLMLLKTDGEFGRLPAQAGKPLVYVVFLATAPWNLPAIVDRPRFRGVGHTLMRAAVELSQELGFKGRVGLHSLSQAEAFYERLGMTLLDRDIDKENLRYCEMTQESAEALLR